MTQRSTGLLPALLLLACPSVELVGQEPPVDPATLQVVRAPRLSAATAALAGNWQLTVTVPSRSSRLTATVLLLQDTLAYCPQLLTQRQTTASGCLQGHLPLEWAWELGFSPANRLHLLRQADSVWAVVGDSGLHSGLAFAGNLTFEGRGNPNSVAGRWSQSLHPDSLTGQFSLRRIRLPAGVVLPPN